jgi:hypothetical protein
MNKPCQGHSPTMKAAAILAAAAFIIFAVGALLGTLVCSLSA